jgi:hypothetical protein
MDEQHRSARDAFALQGGVEQQQRQHADIGAAALYRRVAAEGVFELVRCPAVAVGPRIEEFGIVFIPPVVIVLVTRPVIAT